MARRIVLLLFCVIIGVQTSPVLNLTPCKEDDTACINKITNAIYKLAVQGIPELNIENLDPMHIDEIEGDLAVMKYKLRNSTVEGPKNCYATNTKLDLKDFKLQFIMICPFLKMYGLYESSGRILAMPIEGKGDYRFQCKDYHSEVDIDVKITQGKHGKKYMSLKSFRVNSDLRGGMTVNLSNLFDGKQKELAAGLLRFLNENWKPVSQELQGPVFNANIKKLIKNFNKYLKTVPLDQLIQHTF